MKNTDATDGPPSAKKQKSSSGIYLFIYCKLRLFNAARLFLGKLSTAWVHIQPLQYLATHTMKKLITTIYL